MEIIFHINYKHAGTSDKRIKKKTIHEMRRTEPTGNTLIYIKRVPQLRVSSMNSISAGVINIKEYQTFTTLQTLPLLAFYILDFEVCTILRVAFQFDFSKISVLHRKQKKKDKILWTCLFIPSKFIHVNL